MGKQQCSCWVRSVRSTVNQDVREVHRRVAVSHPAAAHRRSQRQVVNEGWRELAGSLTCYSQVRCPFHAPCASLGLGHQGALNLFMVHPDIYLLPLPGPCYPYSPTYYI